MYAANDLRASLKQAENAGKKTPSQFANAQYGKFYEEAPVKESSSGSTWMTRGQNFLVAHSEVNAGWSFERKEQPDEYMVLIPDAGMEVVLTTPEETRLARGVSLIIMPPGESRLEARISGRVVHLFTTQSKDLADQCANCATYGDPDPNVPPFEPWPAPPSGYKIRVYDMDIPKEDGRFGRIFRCTTFMVNWFEPKLEPRDKKNVSPHHHDDFQQCSLVLDGEYSHHLRWPWTVDMTSWREDEHIHCAAPSAFFIPAAVIHTSAALNPTRNELVVIFSPPRADFSSKAGWVLNADEYPAPAD